VTGASGMPDLYEYAAGDGAVTINSVGGTDTIQMGAGITVEGRIHAVVHGRARLRGTDVAIPDIRSGAALVIAAMCAEGTSVLRNSWHIERGYEDMAGRLASVGALIESVTVDQQSSAFGHTYE